MFDMSEFKDIDQFLLEDCQGKFKDKTWFLGLFGSVIYTGTGEKVQGGFRYYICAPEALVDAFTKKDFAAMSNLPFALDNDGEPDTSALLISLHYTNSGSVLAMQVQEYQNSCPVPITPTVLLEGPAAQAVIETVKKLDQSN
jgi:hypothetical protein